MDDSLAANPELATKVSEALQFLWERSLEDITFVHQPRRPALFTIEGYYLADAARYRELLNPPDPGETKLDQVLRWAGNRVADMHSHGGPWVWEIHSPTGSSGAGSKRDGGCCAADPVRPWLP